MTDVRNRQQERHKVEVRPLGQCDWERCFRTFSDCNFQQEWNYGKVLAARQSSIHEAVGVWNAEGLIGLAGVRIKKFPFLPIGVAYIAGGPLVGREAQGDIARFQAVLMALRDEYVVRRGLILRILAPIGDHEWNEKALFALTQAGFEQIVGGRRYRTLIVNLQRPLNDIRKSLDQKWRNGLNRSEQQGLQVQWSSNAEELACFERLHHDFASKMSLDIKLDASFYCEVFGNQRTDIGFSVAFVINKEGVVAGHLGSYLGDTAVYLLGFTTEQGRKVNAAYFLQWAVLERAQELGCKYYDLGGIDPLQNPGVYHFKAGLRGDDVEAAGPVQASPGRLIDQALSWMEAYRVKRRRSIP